MAASDYETLDPRFSRLYNTTANVERLFTGCRWAEGPAYFPAGRYVVWSDIPNNRMMRWDENDGNVSVFRNPANNSNGNTVDLEIVHNRVLDIFMLKKNKWIGHEEADRVKHVRIAFAWRDHQSGLVCF